VVSYDISEDQRRDRVRKILEGHGQRVQWSVFECHLERADLDYLRERLSAEIDPKTDSIRWYPLCPWCRERVEGQGSGEMTEDPPYFLV